jgi:hypothetical protein
MAVTLKIEDKTRAAPPKRGPKSGPGATGFDAYALEGDHKNGFLALGLWIGILALICLPWWFFEATQPFAYGMPLWCAGSALGVLFVAPYLATRNLKQSGSGAAISSQNQAPLKTLLGKASKVLGMNEPDAFIETHVVLPAPPAKKIAPKKVEPESDEEPGRFKSLLKGATEALQREEKPIPIQNLGVPSVRVAPNTILVHKAAFKTLEPNEISALVVRSLVHVRQGHARRLFLLHFVSTAQPKSVLYLVWPVLIYNWLLKMLWLPHAHQNADRIAMFLVKNPNLMLSAILKDLAVRDANMQHLEISSQDVTNWITQRGHIGASGAEISTQYKLGRAIHEDPPLEQRLQNLQNWAKSSEFTQGLEKLKPSQ